MSKAETNPSAPNQGPSSSPGSRGEAGLAGLLTAIFQEWKREGIAFLILRNYEELPSATTNDVDVLVRPEEVGKAEQAMILAAGRCGYRLHNRVEFATLSCFFYHPDSLEQIQIDLFFQLKWHTFQLLSSSEVLSRRVERSLFAVPDPLDEAIVSLLSRLIYQGRVLEKYKVAILAGFRSSPERARGLLAKPFGQRLAAQVVDRSLREDWAAVEELCKPLRRALIRRRLLLHPWETFTGLFQDATRLLKRAACPGGLMVAVLGADGSGKSTVAQRSVEALKNTFNPGKMLEIHWKPVVFFKRRRQPTGRPNVNPHARPPRSRFASLIYLAAHWVEFLLGSQVQFRRALFKNGLVLVDRYYYDFLVDQRRYRLQVPAWMVRVLFVAIKEPDLVLLFDAPPEVLQSRKREVPLTETARQVQAYRELVRKLPQGHIIDASRPIEQVTTEATRTILQHLYERARRRTGR